MRSDGDERTIMKAMVDRRQFVQSGVCGGALLILPANPVRNPAPISFAGLIGKTISRTSCALGARDCHYLSFELENGESYWIRGFNRCHWKTECSCAWIHLSDHGKRFVDIFYEGLVGSPILVADETTYDVPPTVYDHSGLAMAWDHRIKKFIDKAHVLGRYQIANANASLSFEFRKVASSCCNTKIAFKRCDDE